MNVQISDQAGARTLLLHRPERLNVFDMQLVVELADALDDACADPAISVIVLSGSGRAFSAGADLKELAAHLADPAGQDQANRSGADGAQWAGGISMFARLIDTLADLPKPLLMAVNGVGVGFGMTILAFADLVFMSTEARLRCPFTELGAPPEAASTLLLPQFLGRQNAAWVLLSSEWISAAQAHAMGLAWKLCEPDVVLSVTQHHAQRLAARPASGLTAVKRLINAPRRADIAATVARENAAMAQMLSTGLDQGALDAFTRKGSPDDGDAGVQ